MNLSLYPCNIFTRKNCKSPIITRLKIEKFGLKFAFWNFRSEIMAVLDISIWSYRRYIPAISSYFLLYSGVCRKRWASLRYGPSMTKVWSFLCYHYVAPKFIAMTIPRPSDWAQLGSRMLQGEWLVAGWTNPLEACPSLSAFEAKDADDAAGFTSSKMEVNHFETKVNHLVFYNHMWKKWEMYL